MLTTKVQRRSECYVYQDGQFIGAWLGDKTDIDRLVELSNEDEERQNARRGISINQTAIPLESADDQITNEEE